MHQNRTPSTATPSNSRRGSGKWSALLIAASLAAVPLLAGCDNSTGKADRKIIEGVSTSNAATTTDESTKNVAAFDALSKEADASTARRAIAKAALAGAELQLAQQYVGQLQDQELLAARKMWEMEQVAGQIQKTKLLIDAANRRNPAEALPQEILGEKVVIDNLKNKATAAREGEAWVKSDTAPLATLATVSAVKQQISTLTGKISEINSNIATLTKQRDDALAAAAKSQQESEAAKGEESQKLFIAGADQRKQAAMLGIQIEAAQAALVPLTQDLAAAQVHEKIVTSAADSFDESAKVYTDDFAKVKEQIETLTNSAKSMLNGDKDSLKSKAIELNALMANADALRSKATEQLKAAISHYDDAVKESEKMKTEAKKDVAAGSAEEKLQKEIIAVHEPSGLRLRQAEASANLAAVQAAYAVLLSRKTTVIASGTSAATPLAMSVPAELVDAKVPEALKDARTAADESYKKADELLQNVADGASGVIQTHTAARLARAVVNVGWSQLAAAQGDTETARTRITTARELEKSVADEPNGLAIPAYLMILTDTMPKSSGGSDKPAPEKAAPTTEPGTPAVETPAAQ